MSFTVHLCSRIVDCTNSDRTPCLDFKQVRFSRSLSFVSKPSHNFHLFTNRLINQTVGKALFLKNPASVKTLCVFACLRFV